MKTKNSNNRVKKVFEKFATIVTSLAGSTSAFIVAILLVLAWLISGPIFHYSEKWLLFFNTITDMIVFLMVFLLQKTQNKDSLAIQLKLSELLSSHEPASKELVNAENMTEDELKVIQKYYGKMDKKGEKPSETKDNKEK